MDSTQRRRVLSLGATTPTNRARTALGSTTSRDLRRPRHAGLLQAIHRLDATIDPAERAQLARWISDQYTAEIGDAPLGFVAQCYLGPPYVDHRLDLAHSIVQHYAPNDVMQEPFSQARMLVRTGAYEYVEVYLSGVLIPVRSDGSAVH